MARRRGASCLRGFGFADVFFVRESNDVTSLRVKRSNPEDWRTNDYKSRSDLYCGVNVPDETGKMSRSDKRGATLPKVAATRKGFREDGHIVIPNVVRCSRKGKTYGYFCSAVVSGAGVSFAAAACPSVSPDKGRTGGFFSLNKSLSRIGQTIEEITMSIIVAIRGSMPPTVMPFASPV